MGATGQERGREKGEGSSNFVMKPLHPADGYLFSLARGATQSRPKTDPTGGSFFAGEPFEKVFFFARQAFREGLLSPLYVINSTIVLPPH